MNFKLTFYPRSPKAPDILIKAGVYNSVEDARSFAKSFAENQAPDTELIEIEGEGSLVRELWIYRDNQWKRDDNAERP